MQQKAKSDSLKIKVCGMRDLENINGLIDLGVDYMGLIFYPASSRYIGEESSYKEVSGVEKVGVFVNSTVDQIQEAISIHGLSLVQLHGNESPEFAKQVKSLGVQVIKAFSVKSISDLQKADSYSEAVDYYLFDTKGKNPGGNGKAFDWPILNSRAFARPFFLAGGLNSNNIEGISVINNPAFYAVDLNSGVEDSPAQKNIKEIEKIKNKLAGICQNIQ
ncbi:phosphoribosylanthranilate isomerase [Marinigracilibium pacificum]|uniref:N-(5'-phosphoribosyl)anthranilate isomerase n=1 Tax=Marinigracilibium pacificum TaxID=2729599 RepID=A0A848J4H8_9BACT|nr:phosphoribosylanthranilate isomerase [Marinigracilibium pacificum]NMM50626.1 phosphoribosylanthranilate isomerase [Marinigracilibium pacificum]